MIQACNPNIWETIIRTQHIDYTISLSQDKKKKNPVKGQVKRCSGSYNPAFQSLKQKDHEFKSSCKSIASWRLAWVRLAVGIYLANYLWGTSPLGVVQGTMCPLISCKGKLSCSGSRLVWGETLDSRETAQDQQWLLSCLCNCWVCAFPMQTLYKSVLFPPVWLYNIWCPTWATNLWPWD